MMLSESDESAIENCFKEKGWNGRRTVKKFPGKKWRIVTVNRLITKIHTTGSMAHKIGSGRPRSVGIDENESHVEELIQYQEDSLGTHKCLTEITSDLKLSKSSVPKMANDLKLKPFKRTLISRGDQNASAKRKTRCRNLNNRFLASDLKRIVFTD